MGSIQQHYEHLRNQQPERWNAMNGALASKMHAKSDCLTYFRRSILPKEGKPQHAIDMAVLPHYIVKQFVNFLGFTWEQVESNTIPPISKKKAKA